MSSPFEILEAPGRVKGLSLREGLKFRLRSLVVQAGVWTGGFGSLMGPWLLMVLVGDALGIDRGTVSLGWAAWTFVGVPLGVFVGRRLWRRAKAYLEASLRRAMDATRQERVVAELEATRRARLVGGATEGTPVAVPAPDARRRR